MSDKPKPTLDERLEALTQSLELMQHEQQEYTRKMAAFDQRERRARFALLAGIRAYLEALNGGETE